MALRYNWRDILTRAWSIRFIIIAAILSGLEAGFALISPDAYGIPQGTYAAVSFVATVAAFIARFIVQKDL